MLRKTVPFLIVLALVGAACSTNNGGGGTSATGSGSKGTILIGYPADLSETYAFYDQPIEEGTQFAVDTINEQGGVLGYTLQLKTVDIRNDVAEASKVTQQLIGEGAKYIIGTTGDGILAEGSVACGASIPISTGDGTAPTLVGDMGPCAFQFVMSDNVQGATLAQYALQQGFGSAYVIGSSEIPYTKNLPKYFTQVFEQGGGSVVGTDQYKIGAGDYSAVVTKVQNASPAPDVIFTPMFVPDTQVFLRQLRQAGVTTPVLSTDGNLDPSLTEAGAKALDGFTFTASVCPVATDQKLQSWFADYKTKYGKDPSSEIAALGYDEMMTLKAAIESAGDPDPAKIIDALKTVDYTGITGEIKMDPNTRRAEKSASLVQMQGSTFTCLGQPGYPSSVPNP